ncbi:MAG: lytic transglycosylase domain-containing protein, partial [Myxococcota bacterium]
LLLRLLLGVLLFGFAVGSTPRALAEDVAGVLQLREVAVLTTPRDPADFMNDLDVVLPRPMVVLTREDAVARELLKYTRTMSEQDALRTAHALCKEGRNLGWDPLLFVAVIHIESYYDHLAVSPVGAEGLMQLMPPTAEWMAERADLSWPDSHSFDPVLNVRLGTNYLAHLNTQFRKLDQILTAYNRGPRATRYIISAHGELPEEIRDFYATKVLERYRTLHAAYGHLPIS